MSLPIPIELLRHDKLDFGQIKGLVIKHGFGLTTFEHKDTPCAMSHGVNYALLSHGIQLEELTAALDRFMAGDWGNFYDVDEEPSIGQEYGQYPSSFGSETDTGAIMIHRENDQVKAYFQFER